MNGRGSEFDTCVSQTLVRKAAVDGGMKAAGDSSGWGVGGRVPTGGAFAGALVLGMVLVGVGVGLAVRQKVFTVNEENVRGSERLERSYSKNVTLASYITYNLPLVASLLVAPCRLRN